MSDRPTIIVQARMGSTRLPGKVLREVLGRPLLAYLIERLRRVRGVGLVVATTTGPADDRIVEICAKLEVPVFRGSEDDVLQRYADCAAVMEADPVIRVTADCPLMDPSVVDLVLDRYRAGQCDYAANTIKRTYPRGLDVEVFSAAALGVAAAEATSDYDREHVTPYLYRNPDRFRICSVVRQEDASDYRWTVDTAEDFELVSEVITRLYPAAPAFTTEQVLDLLEAHPELAALNRHIQQRPVEE